MTLFIIFNVYKIELTVSKSKQEYKYIAYFTTCRNNSKGGRN